MNNEYNNSNIKLAEEKKIKKLDLESISQTNKLENKSHFILSNKAQNNSKEKSEKKNDFIATEQDVYIRAN